MSLNSECLSDTKKWDIFLFVSLQKQTTRTQKMMCLNCQVSGLGIRY